MVRKYLHSLLIIAVTFFISYVVNMILLFTNQPQPWGQYTSIMVTIIAFIIAIIVIWLGKSSEKK